MKELLISIINSLREKRPIFHTEADFKHAFALEMNLLYPDIEVRLEYPITLSKRIYIDLWAFFPDGRKLALEMKYKTQKNRIQIGDEVFILKNQGAQDCGCYDALRDIQRIEQISNTALGISGATLFLTNDASYWNIGKDKSANAYAFRINEGVKLSGERKWMDKTSPGTMKDRETPIILTHEYIMKWEDYSVLGNKSGTKLRYLLVTLP